MAEELELVKISELPETLNVAATDVVPVVQNGTTKKASLPVIRDYVVGELGSAAQASTADFEPAGGIAEVENQLAESANQQNERIDRLEFAIYLIQKNGVYKAYRTKAEMLADKANIPVNSVVSVTNDNTNNSETNDINGEYHYNGTDFLKLPDNLLTQLNIKTAAAEANAKSYADLKKAEAIQTAAFDAQIKADEVKDFVNNKTEKMIVGLVSKNLFNPSATDVALGYFPNNTTGVLQANTAYNTTGFIAVTAGLPYSLSTKHYIAWYDADKTFISGTSSSNTNTTQTAPSSAAYLRASASIANWNTFQVEQSSLPTSYQPYFSDVRFDPNTVQENSLSGLKLLDKSVTVDKIPFLIVSKNLFNKATATSGAFIGHDGSLGTSSTLAVSGYIPVSASTQYYGAGSTKGLRFVTYYTAAKAVISGGINDSALATKTFTTPESCAYVRVTIALVDLSSFQLEAGTAATTYAAYGYELKLDDAVLYAYTPDKSITTPKISDSAVTPNKTNFMQLSKNLFNKATVTTGYFINPATGNLTASSTYDTSAMIPITAGAQYYGAGAVGMRFVAFYTSTGALLGSSGISSTVNTFTAPSTAAYARITISHSDLARFQLEAGTVATAYAAYGYVLALADGTLITASGNSSTTEASAWAGKTWATLGDSITAGGHWQSYVTSKLGLIYTNFGIGGTKISGSDDNAMCSDARINAIGDTFDLITLMGGTNDWAQNVTLGAIDSTDVNTFNGALNVWATKAFTRWPTKRLAAATTPYGEIPAYTSRPNWTSPAHNSLGLTTNDYAQAIRDFCKRKNIHCIDVAQSAGWGTVNIETALNGGASTTDHLHPTSGSQAAKGIGAVFISGLNSIQPI